MQNFLKVLKLKFKKNRSLGLCKRLLIYYLSYHQNNIFALVITVLHLTPNIVTYFCTSKLAKVMGV